MVAARLDITIEQGATFQQPMTLTQDDGSNFDLTNYTAKAQIRETYDSAVILDITCVIQSAQDGLLLLSLTAVQTATLDNTEYVYDLIIKDDSETIRLLMGNVNVSPDVTREET